MRKAEHVYRLRQLTPLQIQNLSVQDIRAFLNVEKEIDELIEEDMSLNGWEELLINDVIRISVRSDVPEESRTKILQGLADQILNDT